MKLRALGIFQLVAIMAALTAACASQGEDTSCPAMERAIDEASQNGQLESLPLSVEGGGYRIVLEERTMESNCDTSYRFRISGLDPAIFSSGDAIDRHICGPSSSVGPTGGGGGIQMDDGDFIVSSQVSQWQPTAELTLRVGADGCNGLALSFTHVGRIAQP
jgi:hypothetical protein